MLHKQPMIGASVRRGVHILNASCKALSSTSAAKVSAQRHANISLLDKLRTGVHWELQHGCGNAEGEQRFSSFLGQTLTQLKEALPLSNEASLAVLRAQALSERYMYMNAKERAFVLEDVIKAVELVENTLGKAPPPPGEQVPSAAIPLATARELRNSARYRTTTTTTPKTSSPSPPPPTATPAASTEQRKKPTSKAAPPPPAAAAAVATPQPPTPEPLQEPTTLELWKLTHSSWSEQIESPFLTPAPPQRWVPVVFDFETSRLSPDSAEIVEIAAASPLTDRKFQTLVRLPDGASMDKRAEDITGLTPVILRDPEIPDFRTAYAQFMEFIEREVNEAGPGALPLLVGHNIVRFDVPMLLHRARQYNLGAPLNARMLDTYKAAQGLLNGASKPANLQSHKLVDLFTYFSGKETLVAHRAGADVEMTVTVLKGFLEHNAGVQGSEGFAKFFSRRTLPSAFDHGWVGHVSITSKSSETKVPSSSYNQQRQTSKRSAVKSRREFGAHLPSSTTITTPPSVQPALSSASSYSFADNDFSMEAWAADDPLGVIEERQIYEGTASTRSYSIEALTEAHDSWKALAMDPSVSSTFLNQPLDKIKGAPVRFTPTEVKNLSAAGMNRLVDVLECYPRTYTASTAGKVPDRAAAQRGEEQAISVAVKLDSIKVSMGRGGEWCNMNAVFRIIGPEEAGVRGQAAAALAQGLNGQHGVKLVYRQFRRGRNARWAISHEESRIRMLGPVFAVAGRVEPVTESRYGENCWNLNVNSVEFLTVDQLQHLVESGGSHVRVSYPQSGGVVAEKLADAVGKGLKLLEASRDKWQDPIPSEILKRYGFIDYLEALQGMHRPTGPDHYEACRRRLAFQELMVLQLKLLLQRATLRLPTAAGGAATRQENCITDVEVSNLARRALPYELTHAQDRALSAILDGMAGWPPMMTLLQGDVGCGKTAVAFLAVLAAAGSGYQAAVMAPTEILAEQHFAVLNRMIEEARALAEDSNGSSAAAAAALPEVALLTGSTKRAERTRIQAGLQDGSIKVVVGTHALISDPVAFSNLGLAVIDEQHKFGVAQRAALLAKARPSPHILSMSATPIPRSLALVAHGELNLVTIDELPPGRIPVQTKVVLDNEVERKSVYDHMRREIAAGGQVYIVCPLVDGKGSADSSKSGSGSSDEESSKESSSEGTSSRGLSGRYSELKAAVHERERLVAEGELLEHQCGLLHGRMSSDDKEAALAAFAAGRTPVLISTTVVEVGVDVPAASLIIVEHADRLGLAQLHQLRGRVGRGDRASFCYLITDKPGDEAERLRVLERSSSGFEVAEADFAIRGAGEVIGKRQSGKESLGGLKVCQLPRDGVLVDAAREAAAEFMAASHGKPTGWPKELVAAVVDPALLDLDLTNLPSVS